MDNLTLKLPLEVLNQSRELYWTLIGHKVTGVIFLSDLLYLNISGGAQLKDHLTMAHSFIMTRSGFSCMLLAQ